MSRMSRRAFFGTTAAASLAVTGRASAIEPIQRLDQPHIKLTLAAYSMRKYLDREPGSEGAMDLQGFTTWAAKIGFSAVELTGYYFPETVDADYLYDLKRHCHVQGMDISGGAIRNNFTFDPGSSRAEGQLEHIRTWAGYYGRLGATSMRIFAGHPPRGMDEQHAMQNIVENLNAACELAGEHGIILALENHDYVVTPERLRRVIEGVNSPWFGLTLDSTNWAVGDPYAAFDEFAPYAVNAHVKVMMHPRGRDDEATDFTRLFASLTDADYRGYAALEYEEPEEPYDAIPRYLDELRAAL